MRHVEEKKNFQSNLASEDFISSSNSVEEKWCIIKISHLEEELFFFQKKKNEQTIFTLVN